MADVMCANYPRGPRTASRCDPRRCCRLHLCLGHQSPAERRIKPEEAESVSRDVCSSLPPTFKRTMLLRGASGTRARFIASELRVRSANKKTLIAGYNKREVHPSRKQNSSWVMNNGHIPVMDQPLDVETVNHSMHDRLTLF